jgi:hypothetical protein
MNIDALPETEGQVFSRLAYAFLLVGTVLVEYLSSGRTLAYPWTSFLFIPVALVEHSKIDAILKAVIGFAGGAALWIFALTLAIQTLIVWIVRIAAPRRLPAVLGIPAGCIIALFALCTVVGAFMELFVTYPRNPQHHYSWVYLVWPCFLLLGVIFLTSCDRTNVA